MTPRTGQSKRTSTIVVAAFGAAVLCLGALTAGAWASALAPCTLDVSTTQICPVHVTAKKGKLARVVVAKYEDHSNCDFPAPANAPGDNGNYVVKSVSINWGDRTRKTIGVAHRGTACPGTSVLDSPGEPEPITGTHRYRKSGTYTVRVTLVYVAGPGDTYVNCQSSAYKPGPIYSNISNCIALKSPARSIAIVRNH